MESEQAKEWWWEEQLFSRPGRAPRVIGRENEKRQIEAFLGSDTTTTLHIVGIGGIGKTWLARWLAWEVRQDRVIGWVECSQKSVTVEGLVASIAKATGSLSIQNIMEQWESQPAVGESHPLQSSVDHCTEELDRSRCIIVLEDFHDLDENAAASLQYRFLRSVIQGLRYGKVVIVSRHLPAIWDDPELRAFQTRLRLGGFTLDETQAFSVSNSLSLNPEVVRDLWLKTGHGIPRAVELLVARMRDASSPEQVIAGFPVYSTAAGEQWLSALIQDLPDRAYRALAVISILRRPESVSFCREIWQRRGPTSDFDSRLKMLRSRFLVDLTGDPDEILVPNPVREYVVQKRVSETERAELHNLVSGVYLRKGKQENQSVRRMDCLIESIWHADQSEDFDRMLEAASELRQTAGIGENLALLGQVDHLIFQAATELQNNEELVHWGCLLGNRLCLVGDIAEAIAILQVALQVAQQCLTEAVQFRVLKLLAETHYIEGDYTKAQAMYDKCLQLAASMEDSSVELDVLVGQANAQLRMHQIVEAQEKLNSCRELAHELGRTDLEAKSLCKLGRLYLKHGEDAGDQKKARELLTEALNLFLEVNDQSGQAEANGLLGDFYRYQGESDLALEHYGRAQEIEKRLGHRAKEAITIGQMAFLRRDQENHERALHLSDESLALNERLRNPVGTQIQLVLGAELRLALGKPEEARERIAKALEISSDPQRRQPIGVASAQRALAKYYRHIGNLEGAKDSIERALEGYAEVGSFQYAKETWESARSIYEDWASQSDIETLHQEFDRIARDSTEVRYQDRVALLAELLLIKLTEVEDPSLLLNVLYETLVLRDIPEDKWVPQMLRFCREARTRVPSRIFREILDFVGSDEREELYHCWIAAAIRDEDTNCFEAILEQVTGEDYPFEKEFALLEPLEPEIVRYPHLQDLREQLARVYLGRLALEADRCIRAREPLPPYARDVRLALYYLDRERFRYAEKEIQAKVEEARQHKLVDESFNLVPEEQELDLRDKRVAVLGGSESIRTWVRRDLRERFDLEQLREVPPSWESRANKDKVRSAIDGADLIVVVTNYMGHDLTDCLKAVMTDAQKKIRRFPQSSGKSGIVHAVEEYFRNALESTRETG
jgi:tetratricopeptide (TPR) repeat protein